SQSEQARILQEDLTCPVCLEVYRNPHLLSCGHNFCKTCLDNVKRQGERGRFRCPECRERHRCNAPVLKNLKLASISDNYRQRHRGGAVCSGNSKPMQIRGTSAVPCDYCPSVAETASNTSAMKTCLKCEVSMCPEHVKPHLELPAFRGHPLTEPFNDFWKRKCPDHEEMYQYYCLDDKVCVCNACTVEGGHTGHTIKTMRNTMKDLKGSLEKQLYRVERKYSMAEKKHQEQKEKETQNKKYMEDCEGILNGLCEEMKTAVLSFTSTLRECTRTHCDTNGLAIQKNISKISQDQTRLLEARCGIEALMQETDPFRFIEAYRTTGKQRCRRLLRRNMFYPEYVDMETEALGVVMEMEMRKFLDEGLQSSITNAISAMCKDPLSQPPLQSCHASDAAADEGEDDDDDDELNVSSLEE
uniref:Uncharacterized protein n=1 Tax=Tetraodon nigroviridis TaxID=99883 RepID=H3C173_TETNG